MAGGGVHRLKHTFTAGELSPRLGARLDFDRYKNGCKKLRNMTCQVQGPVTRRPGMKFVYDLNRLSIDTTAGRVREIPFIFSDDQAYALIFFQADSGEIYMVIGEDDDLVHGTGTSEDYGKTITDDYLGQGVEDTFNYAQGDTLNSYIVTLVEETDTGDEVRHLMDPTSFTAVESTGQLAITINTDPTIGAQSTLRDIEVVMELTTQIIPLGTVVALDLPVGFNIEEFDYAQSLDEIYIAQPNMQPIVLIRTSKEHWAWADLNFKCFPDEWPKDPASHEPDYAATKGWPETVTFHQQRLMYGGTQVHQQTVWTSAAGDYLNFGDFDGTGCSGVNAADSITFRLDSGTMNKIKWMISAKVLAIGTIGNEWTVQGAGQASMAPQSLLAQRQTNMGSEKVKPLMVGLSTLFVERHGRTINEIKYEYTTDSYETSDRSVLATHFTDYYSIVDWTFQQTPDQVIWMVRADGAMLGCTYQREHKVVGWHLHDTQGEFKALTAIPGKGRADEVWAVVKREIEGVVHYYVERMEDEFTGIKASEGRFLDSHVVLHPTTEVVSGLDHLEGKEVNILADGTVHPARTVESGAITLDDVYSEVVIGLQYVSEVRPYLQEIPMKSGSSHGRMQRITYVDIDFYKTLGGYLGKYDSEDGDVEEEIVFRIPANLTGQQVPLFSGIYHYSFFEGFDRGAEYFIRQKQPLPMTVRGVVDVIEVQ